MEGDVYAIEFSHRAMKQFLALSPDMGRRIAPRIDALANDPRPTQAKKLEAVKDAYRLRVGDYRIVYQVYDEQRQIVVARVAHRRDVYRSL